MTTVSVITASYNYENYISDTIKSVQAQTFSDWELIIVDDASSDNSVNIIKSFLDDKRIKLICHDKNKGLSETLKTGLKYAQGEWIAFLESDDMLTSDSLEKRLQHKDKADIIFNDVNIIGDAQWIKDTILRAEKNKKLFLNISFPCNIFDYFTTHNSIPTFSSVMIKKDKIKDEYFNTPVDKLLDWWFYIHLSYNNDFFYLDEKITDWRIHSDSYIKNKSKKSFKLINTEAYFDIYKKHKSKNALKNTIISAYTMFFIRLKVYIIGFIRKIKQILGLKLKKSPLYDD